LPPRVTPTLVTPLHTAYGTVRRRTHVDVRRLYTSPTSTQDTADATGLFTIYKIWLLLRTIAKPSRSRSVRHVACVYVRRTTQCVNAAVEINVNSVCLSPVMCQIPNTDVVQICSISGIKAFLISAQLHWTGHIICMSENRLPKQAFYSQLEHGTWLHAPVDRGAHWRRYKDMLKQSEGVQYRSE